MLRLASVATNWRPTIEQLTKSHLGLDAHKDSITLAIAEPGREPARVVGKIAHDLPKLSKLLTKLGGPERLHLVYEAGPTGFGLQRRLSELGYCCEVIAPSKAPRKPGERIKTDGRDAIGLAQSSRAGDLRSVWVPDPADEAIRDLARVREDAVRACTQAKQQLGGFLLRRDQRHPGKKAWTKAHFAWLAQLRLDADAAQVALTEYLLAVQAATARVQRGWTRRWPTASWAGASSQWWRRCRRCAVWLASPPSGWSPNWET